MKDKEVLSNPLQELSPTLNPEELPLDKLHERSFSTSVVQKVMAFPATVPGAPNTNKAITRKRLIVSFLFIMPSFQPLWLW